MIESHSQLPNNDDIDPMMVHIDASSKQLPKHPVQFTSEDLRTHLEPIIHKMIAFEDSYPFQQPVDPVALNILHYPTIIKHPMDISIIHNKLLRGEYKSPLEFCDDIWLMFNNAWLYNNNNKYHYMEFDNIIDYHNKTLLVGNEYIVDHNNNLMFVQQGQ